MDILKKEVDVRIVFYALEHGIRAIEKSYKQYDELVRQDIMFDFKNEFLLELEGYLQNREGTLDLGEEYYRFEEERSK